MDAHVDISAVEEIETRIVYGDLAEADFQIFLGPLTLNMAHDQVKDLYWKLHEWFGPDEERKP